MTKSEAREWRRQKQREYQRRYNQSEKGKARMKRYSGTEKSKERYAPYQHSEKGRETMRRYDASDKRKVVALKVRRTDRHAERHQVYRDERRNNIIEAINDWYSHRTTIEDLQDLVGRELRPEEIDWWWIVVRTDADRFLKLREAA